MKRLSRYLALSSAAVGLLTLVRPRGVFSFLRPSKMAAGALVPFAAIGGGLGALIGLTRKDCLAIGAGLFGAGVAIRHSIRATAPHDGFDRVFGPDWWARIQPDRRARMLPARYKPVLPPQQPVPWRRDVVIGTHVETGAPLLADLWQPPEGVPPTGMAVIYLHGSAWHYLDKDVGTRSFFRHLAGQGHVVLDVAYTLAPRAQIHAMVADVKRAIAWMKTHAVECGVDPERIVLMGGSAGGHLALLSAYTPNDPEFQPADVTEDTSVRAVVSYYGPTDLRATYEEGQTAMPQHDLARNVQRVLNFPIVAGEQLLQNLEIIPQVNVQVKAGDVLPNLVGGTPDEVPEMYRLASPIAHVGPHCPPTLLLQGAHDTFGMMPDVACLHRALDEAGVPSIHVEFPDTEHAFDLILPRWSPSAQAATYDTERFLALMC
jgi:acetyl esterase/lipase